MDRLLRRVQRGPLRYLLERAGLPLSPPPTLVRERGHVREQPLAERSVVVGGASSPSCLSIVAHCLAAAGANAYVNGESEWMRSFTVAGAEYDRAPVRVASRELALGMRTHACVYDATGVTKPTDLATMYDFFRTWCDAIESNGRIIVLGRAEIGLPDAITQATQAALDGFVRSLAKEHGGRGVTAQLIRVGPGVEREMEGPLRFLLSDRSSFITGQVVKIEASPTASECADLTLPLDGKVALITGAAQGIGASTVHALGALGAQVIGVDRPEENHLLERVVSEVGGIAVPLDITSEGAEEQLERTVRERVERIDILVNNAGVLNDKLLTESTRELWDRTVAVNLNAVCRITERLRHEYLRDGGRLIFLSSIVGLAGNFGQTHYSATKSGVAGYARSLAMECAQRGITSNAVAPGFIETRMTRAMAFGMRYVGRRFNALGQGGVPYDVANLIGFLASPGAQGINGQTIRVCGGNIIGA